MSGMEQALRALAASMTGADEADIPMEMEAIIQFTADNMASSGGEEAPVPSVDTLTGATDTGKALMKAADGAAARKATKETREQQARTAQHRHFPLTRTVT